MKIAQLEASESPDIVVAHKARIKAVGVDRFESRHRCKDGRVVDVEVSVTYIGASDRYFSFVHDITDRKRAESRSRAERGSGAARRRAHQGTRAGQPGTRRVLVFGVA